MEPKDVIKDAIAKAAAKTTAAGQALPDAVKEAIKPSSCMNQGPHFPEPKKVAEVEKVRTEPIWPLDKPLDVWKKEREAERLEADKKKADFLKWVDSPEHLAEVRASAAKAVEALPKHYIRSEEKPVKEKVVKEPKEKKKGSQNRLGQTKLIDELLKAGKSETEIIATVKEKIPLYPADKIPQMIKLRRYHVK